MGIRKISISLAYLVLFFGFEENLVYSVYIFFFPFLGKITERSLITQTRKT